MNQTHIRIIAGIAMVASLSGCGSKRGTGASVGLNVLAVSTGGTTNLFSLADSIIHPFSANLVGSNTAAQLVSLKYVFGAISLCESLDYTGSAFSNTKNCITVYQGPIVGDGSSGGITPENLSTYASSQIDLMNADSRAKLNTSAALTAPGTYNYAVMNWYTPIALKANVTVGSTQLYTQAAATYGTGYTNVTDLTAVSTYGETIVVSANGGSFFKFQKPFEITQADIDAKTGFTVDLVFNPDNIIGGSTASHGNGNIRDTTNTNNEMYMPMLQVTPVPRKAGETTKKEVYNFALADSSNYRVELYYNSADTTKAITGATGTMVLSADTTNAAKLIQTDVGSKIISIDTATDGTITLNTPGSGTTPELSVGGLTRGTASTATLSNFIVGGTSGSVTTGAAYTFVGTVDVK